MQGRNGPVAGDERYGTKDTEDLEGGVSDNVRRREGHENIENSIGHSPGSLLESKQHLFRTESRPQSSHESP
jgi:hypothetical protein